MAATLDSLRTLRAFVVVGGAFALGLGCGVSVVREAVAGTWRDYAGLETLARAMVTIERQYIDALEPEALTHKAILGMTSGLDVWSTYHPPSRWAALVAETEGEGAGVGADLRDTQMGLVIARVVPEGPAALAGVPVGGLLESIDGIPVQRAENASSKLQGTLGTPVVLQVSYQGESAAYTIIRDTFEDIRVGGGALPHDLYYIRIGRFTRGSAIRFQQQTQRLPATTRGLVLDLRGNPGGLLSEASDIADRFLPAGLIVETIGRDNVRDQRIDARAQADDLTLPVRILIDEHSASAAEVLAGALQAHGRAQLVGAPSYGKGLVQRTFEFEDGGALRLTAAKYVLSDGRSISHETPLVPDIPVPSPPVDDARSRLTAALQRHVADADARAALLADLAELSSPARDPQAPAPIALGANPADYVGRDAALDAAIRSLL